MTLRLHQQKILKRQYCARIPPECQNSKKIKFEIFTECKNVKYYKKYEKYFESLFVQFEARTRNIISKTNPGAKKDTRGNSPNFRYCYQCTYFCIVSIRAKFPLGCKHLVKGHSLTQTSTIRRSINFENYSSFDIFFNKVLRKEK